MISAIIFYKRSYSTLLMVQQLIHNRFILFGPLVLELTPLNFPAHGR